MFLWVYILGQIKAVFDKHLFADLLLRFQRVLLRVHLSQGVAWAKSSLSLQGVRLAGKRLANNNIKKTDFLFWKSAFMFNPNRSLGCYALTRFLFVICPTAFRLQWNPIAHSKRQVICSKIKDVIIITLMTDLGLIQSHCTKDTW